MDDMMGAIGWAIAIVAMIAIIYIASKKKISKADVTALLDAFLATEAVKNLEDKAWKEIRTVVQEKLGDTPVWPIFKKWFDTDTTSTDEPKAEVKADKPKKIKDKTKTDDEKPVKEEKKVEVKVEDKEEDEDEDKDEDE